MAILKENNVVIDAKNWKKELISKKLEIFYNPVMKFNRDCSILLLNALGNDGKRDSENKNNKEDNKKDSKEPPQEDIKEKNKNMLIALPLAGSGIRGLRFLKELKKGIIEEIHFNDYKENFIGMMKKNLKLNKITLNKTTRITKTTQITQTPKIQIHNTDANLFLLNSLGFDYIDIDPFGTPNPFLDSAVKRISRGGILAVTATDTSALAGTYPLAAKRKYFATPMLNHLMHELGLRILVRKVQMIGGQYDKALVPVFSYAKDHYYRIFFRCGKGKSKVDEILAKHKYFLYCNKCMNFCVSEYNKEKCSCGNEFRRDKYNCENGIKRDKYCCVNENNKDKCSLENEMAYCGLLWCGSLFDKELIKEMKKLNYIKTIGQENKENIAFFKLLLDEYSEEKLAEIVGFYEFPEIMSKYKSKIKKVVGLNELIQKLKKLGYNAVRTHFGKQGIKSDVSVKELVKIING